MSLSFNQKTEIQDVLKKSLRNKFQNYNPEPAAMPFHTRLLGKDRLALFSFIHSLNTNFGTSIFEPVALVLVKNKYQIAKAQAIAGDSISEGAQFEIQKIMDSLMTAEATPNKPREIEIIRKVCQKGKVRKVKLTKVDIFLRNKEGEFFLFDLKSAKPNVGEFKGFKRTLLEWTAAILYSEPKAKINTIVAIPYNPYDPKPYMRWTMRGMLDLNNELKVAEEFWDFLGGKGSYSDLLDCFEKVGIELRLEIDEYFRKFNR
ncbi:MAG TPA: TdeIII family type II restriction endonuclease [Candidatus Omnitrophota bacterium]|nr:TdeIII family type II restriction endonuclease [Candidatus Omnitrophota bacterium]HPN88948.1 TdeIII family type II restriction endonuclease [Candidatus Omnitrophota bacterium]